MSKKWSGRNEFARGCFAEILSDGKTHTYAEICDYTAKQAEGTEFEGVFDKESLANCLKFFIVKDMEYRKISRGVYQKIPCEQAQGNEETPSIVSIAFRKIEGMIAELQKEVDSTFTACALNDKEKADSVESVYKRTCENLIKARNGIELWRAGYEYPDVVDLKNDGSVKVKVEHYQDSSKRGKAMFKIEIRKQICESEVFDLTIENLHYLYGKFQKYQIEPNPFFYKIGDTRKEGAKVRVYSESDFGNSALKLLQDHNNIYDAYLLQKGLGKVREEIKEEIEQNILYEQYKNTEELFVDIHEMTLDIANERLIFYCPLVGKDAKGDAVDNNTVLEYGDKIKQYLEIIFSTKRDLEEHIGRHSELMDKLLFINWEAEELNGVLYGKIDCYLTERLSYEETERLRNTIHMQNTIGIGEEYKYQNMPVGGGKLYISFENREGRSFLYTQEEMEEYLVQEQGGMKFGS